MPVTKYACILGKLYMRRKNEDAIPGTYERTHARTGLVCVEDVAECAREDALDLLDLVASREQVNSRGVHDRKPSTNLQDHS
jgi:hypothetical protein